MRSRGAPLPCPSFPCSFSASFTRILRVRKVRKILAVFEVFLGFSKRPSKRRTGKALEKGSFQNSPFSSESSRDSRELRDSRDFREPPDWKTKENPTTF